MDLHGKIMNIKFTQPDIAWSEPEILAAKIGHRDARHVAAEIALKADKVIEAARKVLSFRDNRPFLGNLRDTNESRDALL